MFATSDRVDVNSITRDGQDRVITAKNRAIAADLIVSGTKYTSWNEASSFSGADDRR